MCRGAVHGWKEALCLAGTLFLAEKSAVFECAWLVRGAVPGWDEAQLLAQKSAAHGCKDVCSGVVWRMELSRAVTGNIQAALPGCAPGSVPGCEHRRAPPQVPQCPRSLSPRAEPQQSLMALCLLPDASLCSLLSVSSILSAQRLLRVQGAAGL
ncbi:hypothetical protein NDU88_008532 [Pleurodeles waltl]|uniref:Uncharacterized protein n=1 Tax=Pleurodeles waltl TaxID=8319 RepID=A0AAV7RW02_PLEWA|nr:hypothetical protein NDU88_008532 [Pleurodeles waltl]